jgi:hypothetical protein
MAFLAIYPASSQTLKESTDFKCVEMRDEPLKGRVVNGSYRPAIAYSRVGTGRTPSAVPSSSKFPISHLGPECGLIARSYRAFSFLRHSDGLHDYATKRSSADGATSREGQHPATC